MDSKAFSFGEGQFNNMFPFYLVIDADLTIASVGKSLKKLLSIPAGATFFSEFDLLRPQLAERTQQALNGLANNQLVIMQHRLHADVRLKGVIEHFNQNSLIFLGTPWFDSMEKVKEKNLVINDFAVHDSVIDLLHIIQTKQIANNDIKELLGTYNEQGKVLRQREAELLETSNRMNQMIDSLQNGILVEDENRNIILTNETFCEMFAIPLSPQQMVGVNCAGFAEQSKELFLDPEAFINEVNTLLALRQKKLNHLMELKDGRYLSRDYIPVFSRNTYKGHLWKYTDITESKRIEQKLENQKKFYEQILNNIPADIAVFDRDHRYLFLNPIAVADDELREWLIGKTDEEYCVYRNKDLAIAAGRRKLFDEVVQSGKQKEWEEKLKTADGANAYHLRRMYPVLNEHGVLALMIGYGVNITERRKIEEQIRLSEARYRSIFDFSLALICTHDLEGIITDVNNAATGLLGFSRHELIGAAVSSIIRKDKRSEFKTSYLEHIKKEGKAEGVMIVESKYGATLYLLYQNYLVTEADGRSYVIGFSQNITARANAEKALKKSEEKYRGIIANMNLGMMEADVHQQILYVNQTFCDICGYDCEELIGMDMFRLFVQNERTSILADRAADSATELVFDAYELMVKTRRGEIKWCLASNAPTFDSNGQHNGSVGIFLDITKQKSLEGELRAAKASAERSAQAKEIFLANMSHEIRTPMNAIIGIGRLLHKTGLAAQQQLYLNTIQSAASNLLVIINDLLDFSKIEAGRISLEYIGFDPDAMIRHVVQVLQHKFEEKGLLIHIHISDLLAPVLIGDPYRLNQVLINLLSNSLKFTTFGSVALSCSLQSDSANSQEVRFEVADTGIGMSEEFLNNLFDKFSQEDESVTRKFGGTGLGMSISKQLIELMGGEIEVESFKNTGTTISFVLRFQKGKPEDIPREDAIEIDSQLLTGKRILLVEDNEMNRLLATTLLQQYGAEVQEAENGEMGIRALTESKFDLVLMDLQMPVMGGIEATQHIRKSFSAQLPIIALTANAYMGEEARCLEAGMNDFISKPFEEQKMLKVIAHQLGISLIGAGKTLHRETPEKLYDLKRLHAISKGDDAFVNKMLSLFVSTIPASLSQLRQAVEAEDFVAVAAVAHRIKPSLQNMGIMLLQDDIFRLEQARSGTSESSAIIESTNRIQNVLSEVIRLIEIAIAD